MALQWNVLEDISFLYRYSGGAWTRYYYYQTDDGIDIFVDNFAAGDAVYFICSGYPVSESHAHKFSGLRVIVDTPIQADAYEYAWEYQKKDNTWAALPNVNDPSNGFQVAGTHDITWDMPTDWKNSYRPCNNEYYSSGFVVRLRVVSVTNPTEGGKFGTGDTIKHYNYAYTTNDSNTYTPEDIYQLDQSLGNNLVTKTNDGLYYLVNANVVIDSGKLKVPFKTYLVVGKMYGLGNESFEINLRENGELEIDGGYLKWNNGYFQGSYNYWNGKLTMKHGAHMWRYGGGYVAQTLAGELDIQDSQFVLSDSTAIYFHANSHGSVRRTNMSCYYFYVYTGRISWEDVQQIPTPDRATTYSLLGGTSRFYSVFKGFNVGNISVIQPTQGQEFYLINPVNFDEDKIALGTTYGRYSNVLWEAYELYLEVYDEKGNPVENAVVYVLDRNGHTALIHDWFKTDGYAVSGLSYDYLTHAYFRKYSQDLNSYIGQRPPFVEVGSILRLRGEYIKITNLTGSAFDCERNQTYKGYTSIGYPAGLGTPSPLYTEEDYILTNADGKAVFSGEYGEFIPLLIRKAYIEDKNDNRQDRLYEPFTIIVAKAGFEPATIPNIYPRNAVHLRVVLRKARPYVDLEEM